MADATDPNQVRLTGENSFIRLVEAAGGPETTRTSHWRIWLSPGGAGHVLFMQSTAFAHNAVRIYTDNIAMMRWLQEEIESLLFPPFANQELPVIEAEFSRQGDTRTFWTETVLSDDETIALTWYDFLTPFVLRVAPGSVPGRLHGVYSCFIPARRAQLTVNGVVAAGQPAPAQRNGWQSSSACLALSETWVRPA
jgi:hypothetical protein